MAELKKVSMIVMLAAGAFLALMLVADIIVFSVCLPRLSCVSYRQFKGGKGEMNYCILYPADDDMKFSFDHSSDNHDRTDSTAYLLAPPIEMYRHIIQVKENFENVRYTRYHYLFPDDYISGKVTCTDDCTVYVTEVTNPCRSRWNETIYNQSKVDFAGVLGRKKNTKNRCGYVEYDIFKEELEGGGTINFHAEARTEAPHYVYVKDGLLGKVSGSVDYRVMSTTFNVSNAIAKCNSYNCEFSELSGQGRTDTYVAVNIFSDKMEGQYEMDASRRPDKILNQDISIGFAIATGAVFVVCLIGFAVYLIPKLLEDDSGSSSESDKGTEAKSTQNTSGNPPPLFDDDEVEMQNPAFNGMEETPGSNATVTASDETAKPDVKTDPVDPAPDYYSIDGGAVV